MVIGDAAVWTDVRIDRAGGPGFDAQRLLRAAGEDRVPAAGADPGVDLAYRAEGAGPDPFARLPDAVVGVPLVAHLRHDAGFLRHLGHEPRLPNVVGEGLLAVNVLARPH